MKRRKMFVSKGHFIADPPTRQVNRDGRAFFTYALKNSLEGSTFSSLESMSERARSSMPSSSGLSELYSRLQCLGAQEAVSFFFFFFFFLGGGGGGGGV